MARRLVGDSSGALSALKRSVELNPDDAIAQYRLGAEYLRQNRLEEALQHLQTASKLSPDDQSTLNAVANALRQSGRVAEADAMKKRLAEVIRRRDRASQDQLKALRLNNEGAALEKKGDLPGALQHYQEAHTLYPDHSGIQINYAVALLRSGKWTEGLSELHRALERDPGNEKLRRAWQDAVAQAPEWARNIALPSTPK
jgi:tetratricopeptide (TPR) repeat protein